MGKTTLLVEKGRLRETATSEMIRRNGRKMQGTDRVQALPRSFLLSRRRELASAPPDRGSKILW